MPRFGKQNRKATDGAKAKAVYAEGALGSACRKTKLCSFFQQGCCPRGGSCNFAHGEAELQQTPDLSKTKMCPSLMKYGTCCRGSGCTHAHSTDELRAVGDAVTAPVAGALAAEWQRRWELNVGRSKLDTMSNRSTEESDGSMSEISSASLMAHESFEQFEELMPNQPRAVEEAFVVNESFLEASRAERLTDGSKLFFAPIGIQLAIRNTFFDVDDAHRPAAARRSHSVGARFSSSQ